MNTGSILLCSGNGGLSKRIKKYQRIINKLDDDINVCDSACDISHVAMVISEGVEVFESTSNNKWANKKGVQINPFIDWLENYDGQVWVRDLIFPEDVSKVQMNDVVFPKIQEKAESMVGMPYEHGIFGGLELALAGIEWEWFVNTFELAEKLKTKDGVHCSESDAEICKFAEIISKFARTNKMPPMHWWGDGCFDEWLINEFKYSKPILIKG